MSLEIKKTEGISTQNASTPVLNGGTSSDIEITLNKNQEIPQPDKKTEEKIKFLVAALYPKVNWDELSSVEKQNFIAKFYDGSLQKEAEKLKEQITAVNEKLKTLNPQEAKNYLLDLYLAQKYDGYENKSEAEKDELRDKLAINLLDKMQKAQNQKAADNGLVTPYKKTIGELSGRAQEKALARNEFKLQSIIYAYQNNKLNINSQEEITQLFQNPVKLEELEFEYASKRVEDNKEILNSNKPNDRSISLTYQIGEMNREIAKSYGMELEEFIKSENRTQMVFDYLSKKENRSEFEEKIYRVLRMQSQKLGGDLSKVKNHGTGSIEDSYLHQIFKDKEVDILNLTTDDIAVVKEQIIKDLSECKTPEEKTAVIAKILNSTRTDFESDLIHGILAGLEKDGTIDAEIHLNANHKCGQTAHMAVLHSTKAGTKNQIAYSKYVAKQATAENGEFSDKQAAGYTKNIIPDYEVEAQAPSTNTMTDTGLQAVYDVLPETYSKLDESAAKEAYEYAMTSENISADQKAIMARDTIDMFGDNKDMQEFFESIANKNNIDYKSVPPKSERVKAEQQTTDNTQENVANTNYTEQELTEILNSSAQPQNFFMTALNGARETLEIILGKTPDTNTVKAEVQKIDSINTAISELKSGAKLTDVFKGSTLSVQKDLVGLICSYGKIAIGQLIDAFGGETIYKMAKNKNHKELIKKEIERIALSDSTQRVALAEIKKQEAKQGFMSRA